MLAEMYGITPSEKSVALARLLPVRTPTIPNRRTEAAAEIVLIQCRFEVDPRERNEKTDAVAQEKAQRDQKFVSDLGDLHQVDEVHSTGAATAAHFRLGWGRLCLPSSD